MIRTLIVTPVLLIALYLGGLYAAYGQADPCRALAVERARRALAPSGLVEPWTRFETSQMSTAACAGGLLYSWRDRILISAL